jgi:hypothetical protein
MERSLTRDQETTIREVMNRPDMKDLIDEDLRAILDGLDASDRDAFLGRARASKQRIVFPVSFELSGDSMTTFRLRDAIVGSTRLSAVLLPAMKLMKEKGGGRSGAYDIGRLAGYAAAGLVLIVLLVRKIRGS